MKRSLFITFFLMVCTCVFAYNEYDSYSYSNSTGLFESLFSIIMFIVGILQIILFFKIWGMTNNIKALKKDYFNEANLLSMSLEDKKEYIRRNLVLGKKDNVKKLFLMTFIQNITNSYTNNKASIRPYVDNLKKQYEKIGEELPPYISKMETFGDFFCMFTDEDFKIERENSTLQHPTVYP